MYRIGELAKACGVKADTLRFYEKNGLISPGIRNESGYRLYRNEDKRRLEFIIRSKSVGFSLAEIAELLNLDTNKAKVTCQEVKAVADAKLLQLEQKLIELIRFRDNLRELSNICCGGPRSAEHCAILETLESGTPAHHEHHDHDHDHDQRDPVHG
ncbi:MAG: Zn(2+)-responsive transcriptional regulator [Aeromonas sp.]